MLTHPLARARQITRDRWITHWLHPEAGLPYKLKLADEPAPKKRKAAVSAGKGGGKGKKGKVAEDEDEEAEAEEADDEPAEAEEEEAKVVVENISGMDDLVEVLMGSGYPSGPSSAFLALPACRPRGRLTRRSDLLRARLGRPDDQGLPPVDARPHLWLPVARPLQLEHGQGHPREGRQAGALVRRLPPSSFVHLPASYRILTTASHSPRSRVDQKGGGGKKFFSASREAIADRERVRLWAEVGLKSVGEL